MREEPSASPNRKDEPRQNRRIKILKSSVIGGVIGATALPMVMLLGRMDSGPNYTTIFVGLLLELPANLLCRMFGSSLFLSHSNDPKHCSHNRSPDDCHRRVYQSNRWRDY